MGNQSNENERNKSNIWKALLSNFLILLVLFTGFASGMYYAGQNKLGSELSKEGAVFIGQVLGKYSKPEQDKLGRDIDFDLYWEVWDSLEQHYVDKDELNEKELFYGSLRGMVDAVGDPYTVFMNPKNADDFNESMKGEQAFEGIGAEIGIKNKVLTIIAPLPGMPAEKAGLKPGDKILAINNESTSDLSIDEAVDMIRGEKGTEVTLSVARETWDKVKDIEIKRDSIVVHTVRPRMREDNIFVIRITNFNEDTEQAFNNAVQDVIKENPEGIILDLRNNPGGYLDTAIEVASEWIDSKVVVTEKYNEDKKIQHLSQGRPRLQNFRTVVLVNEGSASASEIVAGALGDHGKAVVLGEKTFGKGSVQRLNNFTDGSSIKITVAKWLTPNGSSINDEGINPDMEIEFTEDDYNNNKDPQMEAAIKALKSEIDIPEAHSTTTPVASGTTTIYNQ